MLSLLSCSSYSVFIPCCPFHRDDRIYPIPSAIARAPSLHLSRLRASSFFKPVFSVSSSTCFFQVFFGRPRFLLPLTSRFRATLKTLSSSLLSTCPYHLTPFAVANLKNYYYITCRFNRSPSFFTLVDSVWDPEGFGLLQVRNSQSEVRSGAQSVL